MSTVSLRSPPLKTPVQKPSLPRKWEREAPLNLARADPSANGNHGSPAILKFAQPPPIRDLNIEGVPTEVPGQAPGLETGSYGGVGHELSVAVG